MKQFLLLVAAVMILASSGCANKKDSPERNETESDTAGVPGSGSRWYYFSDSGIHPTDKPSEIPARAFVPWTEAVRVTDAAIINKAPSLLINRLGLMTSGTGGEASALHTDSLFSANTAAALYHTGSGTGIRLYRSSFFSPSESASETGSVTQSGGICIAEYKNDSGTFGVYLTAKDLELPPNAQCVALDRIGSMWYASFKYEKNSKVEFKYLEFESFPERKEGRLDLSGIRRISSEAYQKSVAPFAFADAPDMLKTALAGLPENAGFNLRVYSPVSKSAQVYIRPGDTSVDGTAFVSDDKTAVLFADGTFYYLGDNSAAKKQVFQLPGLANGYVYTTFILTGKSLLAAWEEQRFFETGRAGLLEITIPDGI